MSSALVRELIDAGIHFGHRASRWNPKMGPYIFGKRNSIHIIDIRETVKGLLRAKKFVTAVVSAGQDVLFVGTKRQARDSVAKHAERVGMHYVNERWLGGTLTNFKTIRSRLGRLEHLETLEKTGESKNFSKKEQSRIAREREKIARNLDGIRRMTKVPGAIVLVDIKREHIAVKEAAKLRIPTVCLVDTDSDPDGADILIPGNDDAMRGIELIISQLADAAELGKRGRQAEAEKDGEQSAGGPGHRRRSKRASTSSVADGEHSGDDAGEAESVSGAAPTMDAESRPAEVSDGVS
ncbi:MAG: 30S ribosomal protein S2 [Phycisphaerales bacterium]|nr:30S ribosomal protein S2 [Phycisphaerales bacterium]